MDTTVSEVKKSVDAYLVRFIEGIHTTCEKIRTDELNAVTDMVIALTDGLDYLVEAITAIKGHSPIDIEVASIVEFLKEIQESLQNQDYVLLSDLLEYELLPVAQEWQDKLNALEI